jgi:hypothetical protein
MRILFFLLTFTAISSFCAEAEPLTPVSDSELTALIQQLKSETISFERTLTLREIFKDKSLDCEQLLKVVATFDNSIPSQVEAAKFLFKHLTDSENWEKSVVQSFEHESDRIELRNGVKE